LRGTFPTSPRDGQQKPVWKLALLATPSRTQGTGMQTQQAATPDFSAITKESASEFDLALHKAVRNSVASMDELRVCVGRCVEHLKQRQMGPVQVILTMKAMVRESVKRYRPFGDEEPRSNSDIMTDYVVKWAIIAFYGNVS
jgi:hypothetical protein